MFVERLGKQFGRLLFPLSLALALTSCSALDTPSTAPTDRAARPQATPVGVHAVPAVVLGDSLTVQATERITDKLPNAVIDATIGRTIVRANLTDEALSRIPELVAVDAAWFVVELGTNDSTFGGESEADMTADVATLLDTIGRNRCIAWVLPFARSPRTSVQIADTETFRRIATEAVESLTCGRVLDWGAVAVADPNLIASDGVHLTDLGMQRMADLIVFGIS